MAELEMFRDRRGVRTQDTHALRKDCLAYEV